MKTGITFKKSDKKRASGEALIVLSFQLFAGQELRIVLVVVACKAFELRSEIGGRMTVFAINLNMIFAELYTGFFMIKLAGFEIIMAV